MNNRKIRSISLFIGIFTLLSIALANMIGLREVANENGERSTETYMKTQLNLTDYWLIGSIKKTRYHGLFVKNTFTARFLPPSCGEPGEETYECLSYTVDKYKKGEEYDSSGNWDYYKSNLRLHITFYVMLDQLIYHCTGEYYYLYDTFKWIDAIFIAIVLSLFMIWAYNEFGVVAAIILYIAFFSIRMLTNSNPAQSTFIVYLPFLVTTYFFAKKTSPQIFSIKYVLALMITLILNYCRNYELVPIVAASIFIPIIYYWNKYGDKYINIFKIFFLNIFVVIGSFLFVLYLHFNSLAQIFGVHNAQAWFKSKFVERVIPSKIEDLGEKGTELLQDVNFEKSHLEVVDYYFSAFNMSLGLNGYSYLIFLVIVSIIYLLLLFLKSKLISADEFKLGRLLSATWISFIGVMGYFLVFKGHAIPANHFFVASYIQYFFIIFIFILLSVVIQLVFNNLKNNI